MGAQPKKNSMGRQTEGENKEEIMGKDRAASGRNPWVDRRKEKTRKKLWERKGLDCIWPQRCPD
jgi:hypothetical protein